ncbi:MAG: twin-arginine translocase TatA/TatE family subunit [Actinobacteria bacterium]|nr:twin-arginine translocase TatA/TatE family subunit [Actinomycetota bacterium]
MFSGNEWLIIAVIALVLFGGSQLPKFARNIGEAQKEFKKGMADPAGDAAPTADEKKPA